VLVLPPGDAGNETTADATRRERGSGEPDDAETGADGTVVDEADADEADADVTGATKQGSTPDPPSPSN
jgi:hypothetical protein